MPGQTPLDKLPTMLDTDALATVAQAIRNLATALDGRVPRGDIITVTTDASGNATIAHGLGRVPETALAGAGSAAYIVGVSAITATDLTINVRNNNGTATVLASTSISIRWLAV